MKYSKLRNSFINCIFVRQLCSCLSRALRPKVLPERKHANIYRKGLFHNVLKEMRWLKWKWQAWTSRYYRNSSCTGLQVQLKLRLRMSTGLWKFVPFALKKFSFLEYSLGWDWTSDFNVSHWFFKKFQNLQVLVLPYYLQTRITVGMKGKFSLTSIYKNRKQWQALAIIFNSGHTEYADGGTDG